MDDLSFHRRVVVGSVEYVSALQFEAVAAEVEHGTWILYEGGAWWNGPSRVSVGAFGFLWCQIIFLILHCSRSAYYLDEPTCLQVITPADGRVKMTIGSVRLISDKLVMHLFE